MSSGREADAYARAAVVAKSRDCCLDETASSQRAAQSLCICSGRIEQRLEVLAFGEVAEGRFSAGKLDRIGAGAVTFLPECQTSFQNVECRLLVASGFVRLRSGSKFGVDARDVVQNKIVAGPVQDGSNGGLLGVSGWVLQSQQESMS